MTLQIVIVGVGALGSHLVQGIRNLPCTIKIVDYDFIEQKNVLSQFYGRQSIGRNKTQALQQLMQFLFNKKIETIPHKLTSDNVHQLLSGSGLVIDCLDNGPSRKLVQDYVRKHKIPCLHGGLSGDGMFGRVIWDDLFVIDEAVPGAATCENGEHLPFIINVASYLALAVQNFLTKGTEVSYNVTVSGAKTI